MRLYANLLLVLIHNELLNMTINFTVFVKRIEELTNNVLQIGGCTRGELVHPLLLRANPLCEFMREFMCES